MYALMALRHGNPIWPVRLSLGPVTLPGDYAVAELLAAGAAVPHATGSLLERLSVSWLALDSLPVFDMKLGGFGLLGLLALPLGLAALVRRRAGWLVLGALATVLSPDPSIARYVLAFPALLLALSLAEVSRWPRHARSAVVATLVAVAGWQVVHAWPGLSGDGPQWSTFLSLSDEERRVALGPYGAPAEYPPTWALVGDGEAVAFDTDFEFPGLLWDPRLTYPVYAVPDVGDFAAWLEARQVRVVAVGPRHGEQLDPGQWRRLFTCKSADCAVYARQPMVAAAPRSR
jgi:hypothetical protein